jgi:hypothetical protein
VTVIFGAVAGGILTLLAGSEPGWLLGLFVILATAVGTSAVRRTAAYLVIPVPALAYFVAAVIAGLIHDRNVDTTRAILFVNGVQWIASGFFWMFLSTVIAIAITTARWLMTGRAGYRAGVPWLARFGTWSDPGTTRPGTEGPAAPGPANHQRGAARSSTGSPTTSSSSTGSSGTGSSSTGSSGATGSADAANTQPLPREALDSEHSADA